MSKTREQIKLRIKSLDDFKPGINKVLVRVAVDNKKERTKSGLIKVGDVDFDPAYHSNRICEIVKLPESLLYGRDEMSSLEWKTDIELKIGDVIWCSFMGAVREPLVMCQGEVYYILNYGWIRAAKRFKTSDYDVESMDCEVIMPNGNCLFETVEEKHPVFDYNITNKSVGIASYLGKPVYEYKANQWSDEGCDINLGDKVMFRRLGNNTQTYYTLLEEKLHAKFNGNKTYIVGQRRQIDAIIYK